jgi:hypothetical protein
VAGSEPPHIVLDQQGIFWIFVGFDGIYSYNPATKTTEKWIDLPELDVDYTALSPDGSIYFAHQSSLGNFRLVGDELYQFFPETGKVESVGLPASNEEWPIFAGLLVDHIGRLWLGSTGYRDLGGAWHLMHPYPERYFEIVDTGRISYIWAFPRPILESSDGILWFQKYLDTSGQWEGTAWYDPNLGEGCLITNMPTNIVEDSHQQLWMMVDGILYRYSLNAQ